RPKDPRMSEASGSSLGLVIAATLGLTATVEAADLTASGRLRDAPRVVSSGSVCPCYSYAVRHRALLSTYGAGFDPNNYDFTEPHYFLGPVRTYRRYSRERVY